MKLIFVRHGQTDWNVQRLLQGKTDIALNQEGFSQAEQLRNILQETLIHQCISSPLMRAKQTAEVICRGRKLAIQTDARISEREFGIYEGAFFDRSLFNTWWQPDFVSGNERVEPLDSFIKRVANFLDELYQTYPTQTVLMVSHGGVSIAVQRYFYGESHSPEEAASFLPNCTPVIFEKE